jgi:histidine triad (HIT) family protein
MAITDEQAQQVKEQLLKQLSNFPEERQDEIKKQVESMTPEQVEAFIEQNKLTHMGNKCVFCSIISGETPSFKIEEDKENIAILELNPLSKGHTLIVPKDHDIEKASVSTTTMAERIAEKIKKKFEPKEVQVNETKIMEHPVVEIIPIYGNEKDRSKASEEELKALQEELARPEKEIEILPEKLDEEQTVKEEVPKVKPRIPN